MFWHQCQRWKATSERPDNSMHFTFSILNPKPDSSGYHLIDRQVRVVPVTDTICDSPFFRPLTLTFDLKITLPLTPDVGNFFFRMHQNRWRLGLRPRPHWGSLQSSPRPPSWIQGVLLLRGGAGGEAEGGKERGGRGVIGGFRGAMPPKKPKVAP